MPRQQSQKGIFVTGSDTGVGKTYIGTRLLRLMRQLGATVQARKPAESGCRIENKILIPDDGLQLMKASGEVDLDIITPYRFKRALSPVQAARLENKTLRLQPLITACRVHDSSFVLVEGAGGFLSPLAEDGLNADLAIALQLPVLLVVADKLGCVNHCLLTLEAIRSRGLDIAAIVLNRIDATDEEMDNLGEIKRLTDVPVYPDSELEDLAQVFVGS